MKNFKRLKRFVAKPCFYVDNDILWSFGPDYFNLYTSKTTLQWDNCGGHLKLHYGLNSHILPSSYLDVVTIHNIYNIDFMDYLHKEAVHRYENTPAS